MKANKPFLLGLTGGIASGKSHVAKDLRALGCPVIDADAVSHDLTAKGGPALPMLRQLFGDTVFLPDGALDRAALASIVFADPKKLSALNDLLHPMIFHKIDDEILSLADVPLIVLEIPLLFETGANKRCDEVWTVFVPYEEQLRRLMRRSGLSQEDAVRRIDSQMPTGKRIELADVAIDTSGPYEETEAQVALHLKDLKRRLNLE